MIFPLNESGAKITRFLKIFDAPYKKCYTIVT